MLISNNNLPVSATTTLAVCVGMGYFMVLRPWILSGLIIVIEIYCLELYIYRKSIYYLILLPVLSVLLINLHAALWPIFFIFLIPYLIDGLKFHVQILRSHGYGFVPIFIAALAAGFAGLLNPYSTDAMTYLYYSYNNPYIKSFISEMGRLYFDSMRGYLIFGMYILTVFAYCLYTEGTSRLRYVLLTLTTACMGLSSGRSVQYFLITFPYLAYYYRDFDIIEASELNKKKSNTYIYIKLLVLLVLYCLIIFGAERHTEKRFYETFVPQGPTDYVLNHLDVAKIRLYNDYDMGDFLMFKGIRPFIDSRADVFLKSNNKKEEILNDYFELLVGRTYYKDFIQKYRFSHYLTVRGSLMDTYLSRDSHVQLLYEDGKFRIFQQGLLTEGVGPEPLSADGP